LKIKDVEVEVIGYGNEPVSLGDLIGNHFEIIIRDIDKRPKPVKEVPNYFDEQRFGKKRNNHLVGKNMIKGNFKNAAELIDFNYKGTDYVGFLRRIPKKILMMYVHAYQSYLWNSIVNEYLQCKYKKNARIPIVGFGTEVKDKRLRKIVEKIMEDENITFRDFIIRAMPELSSQGNERDMFVKISKLKIGELEDDELNKGKRKIKISFCLPKGAYATNVIKMIFNKGNICDHC